MGVAGTAGTVRMLTPSLDSPPQNYAPMDALMGTWAKDEADFVAKDLSGMMRRSKAA